MSEPTLLLAPLKPKQLAPRLWRQERFVEDAWQSLGDDEPLRNAGHIILSLTRWRADQPALATVRGPLGVRLAAGETLDLTPDDLARLTLVALPFPKFSDGRSYSTARRLRAAGYRGEIRATGDVLLDQLPLMLRSGFDAFEIVNAATIKTLERAPVPAVKRVYQTAADAVGSVWLSRRVNNTNDHKF